MKFILMSAAALAAAYAPARTLNVLTTTPDLASIVQEVGGARVSVSSVVVGARDPHRIEAKPSFISRAARADLFVAIGLDLEVAWEDPILVGSRNSRIVVGGPGHVYVSQWVAIREKPTGVVTRAQGDLHPGGNPHLWLDPYNGRVIALRLAEKMGQLDPSNASWYKSNAASFADRIDNAMFGAALVDRVGGEKLWRWDSENALVENLRESNALQLLGGWCGKMRPFWRRSIVTYHRSWGYFAHRFGLKVVGELEPKPGIDPSPGHMANVIRTMQSSQASVILQEPFYSTRSANFVAARTGATVVVAPGNVGHTKEASDYIGLFDTIITKLSSALGK